MLKHSSIDLHLADNNDHTFYHYTVLDMINSHTSKKANAINSF